MPRKKKDDVDKETLFLSLYFQLDRALKQMGMHSAYDAICEDFRSLLRLARPVAEKILDTKNLVKSDDRH